MGEQSEYIGRRFENLAYAMRIAEKTNQLAREALEKGDKETFCQCHDIIRQLREMYQR